MLPPRSIQRLRRPQAPERPAKESLSLKFLVFRIENNPKKVRLGVCGE